VSFRSSFPQVHESRLPEDSKDYVDEMDQNRVRLDEFGQVRQDFLSFFEIFVPRPNENRRGLAIIVFFGHSLPRRESFPNESGVQ